MTAPNFAHLDDKASLFKPFEWVPSRAQTNIGRYTTMATIRDLASGVSLALEMVERSQLDIEREAVPVIDSAAAARFTRMSIAVVNVIEDLIDGHFENMNDSADRQRKAGEAK